MHDFQGVADHIVRFIQGPEAREYLIVNSFC